MVSISRTIGKFTCWVFRFNECWKNLWKFLGSFLLVPYFQNMIERVPHTRGYTPFIIQHSDSFFLRHYHFFNF